MAKKSTPPKTKLPKKVDFGLLKADMAYRAASAVPGNTVGHFVTTDAKIYIDDSMHPLYEKDTVLHECLHGILRYNELLPEQFSHFEEDLVKALSPALLIFLRRNPKLVDYLMEKM